MDRCSGVISSWMGLFKDLKGKLLGKLDDYMLFSVSVGSGFGF